MSDNLKYTATLDDNPVKQALDRVGQHFKTMGGGVNNVTAGIQGALGKVNLALAGVAATLAGGAIFKAAVDATKEFTGEANKLGRVLGISATEASTLNIALGDVFADADVFTAAAGKLAKEVRTNEDALKKLGLVTRDANGQLRPLKDLMMDSITVVNSYKQGIDRNIAAQIVWGKGAEEASSLLKLSNEKTDEARLKQQALGLTVGVENVQALKAYKNAMNDSGDVMLGIKKVIGDAVMPILTMLGQWFAEVGPAAVAVIRTAVQTLVTVFWTLKDIVVAVWQTFAAFTDSIAIGLVSIAQGFGKILSGDLNGGVSAFRAGTDTIKEIWTSRMKAIEDSAATSKNAIANLFNAATPTAAPSTKGRSAAGQGKGGADESRMAGWDAELNILKQARAEENALNNTFHAFTHAEEKTFWQGKLDLINDKAKEWAGVNAKFTTATLEIQKDAFEQRLAAMKREEAEAEQNFARKITLAQKELALIVDRYGAESKQAEEAKRHIDELERQARDQRQQIRSMDLAEIEAAAAQAVNLERQRLQFMLDAGLITRAEMLAQEQNFERSLFELRRQRLEAEQAQVDPNLNPVEYARIKNEILELERQHQLQLSQIQQQRALESTKDYRTMFQNIESGWGNVIKGFLNGTKTVGQTVRGIFATIGESIIGMLATVAARWMAQQLMMLIFGKTMAAGTIAEKAGEAGAAGVASMAGAPWPLNMTAPAFGAAMSAAALAFAPMASASQGYDIPAGVNPITQLHQREMVLPEGPADVIRSLAANGGGGGDNHYWTVNALDGASVKRVLMDNPDAFAAAASHARRRGFKG